MSKFAGELDSGELAGLRKRAMRDVAAVIRSKSNCWHSLAAMNGGTDRPNHRAGRIGPVLLTTYSNISGRALSHLRLGGSLGSY